jgi:hypothetical protein
MNSDGNLDQVIGVFSTASLKAMLAKYYPIIVLNSYYFA